MPRKLRQYLADRHVVTLAYQVEWHEKKNGDLIASAEAGGYELLITADQSLAYQQNLAERKIAILVLIPTDWNKLKPHVGEIKTAVENSVPGSYRELQFDNVRRNRELAAALQAKKQPRKK